MPEKGGVLYLVIAANYFLLPPAQLPGNSFADAAPSIVADPFHIRFQYLLFALVGLLQLAVVGGVHDALRQVRDGWLQWAGLAGLLGASVMAVSDITTFQVILDRARVYVEGSPEVKAAIAQNPPFLLDPQGLLTFGCLGFWVVTVSRAGSRQSRLLPPPLGWLGLATGAANGLLAAGLMLKRPVLTSLAAGLGGMLLTPAWYIWLGLRLNRLGLPPEG